MCHQTGDFLLGKTHGGKELFCCVVIVMDLLEGNRENELYSQMTFGNDYSFVR